MGFVTIHLEPTIRAEDSQTIAARIEGVADAPYRLWYRVPSDHIVTELAQVHAFLVSIINQAMATGRGIVIDAPVPRGLATNLDEYQRVWCAWKPESFRRVDLRASKFVEDDLFRADRGAIMSFSGGLDSSFSAKMLSEENQLAATVVICGLDVRLTNSRQWAGVVSGVRRLSESLGRPLLAASTNWEEVVPRLPGYVGYFAPTLAVPILLSHRYGYAVAPSSYSYDRLTFPLETNPITDPLLGRPGFPVRHHGAWARRIHKIAAIADWPEALLYLRPCDATAPDGTACGKCRKCIQTALTFCSLGLQVPPALGGKVPHADDIARFEMTHYAKIAVQDAVAEAQRRGATDDWITNIERKLTSGSSGRDCSGTAPNRWFARMATTLETGVMKQRSASKAQSVENADQSSRRFLELAYQAVFRRPPDEGGLAAYLNFMRQGGSPIQVLENFVNSVEFRLKCLVDRNLLAKDFAELDGSAEVHANISRFATKEVMRQASAPGFAISPRGRRLYVESGDLRGAALIQNRGEIYPTASQMWRHLLESQRWTHIVDIGANYGEMIIDVEPREGQVLIAVEPNPYIRKCLARSVRESGLPIKLMAVAVSDRPGMREFNIDRTWSGFSGIELHPHDTAGHHIEKIQVKATTLRAILHDGSAEHEKRVLVKIDVEGHESAVLRGLGGAERTFADFAALVEIRHVAAHHLAAIARTFAVELFDQEADTFVRIPRNSSDQLFALLRAGRFYREDAVLRATPTRGV